MVAVFQCDLGFIGARRPLAIVDPLLNRTTLGYDPASRQVQVKDANGNVTTAIFDPANRPVATVDAMNFRTTQVFDPASRMVALVDANSNRTTFQFDAAGQNTVIQDPLLRRTTFTYSPTGKTASRWDARGNRTTFSYDPVDRPTGRNYSDGTRATFAFDPVGNRTLMADSTGRTTSTFDPLNRPASVVNPSGMRITYSHTPVGLRAGTQDPDGGRTSYAYDPARRIANLVNPLAERTTFAWDAAGQMLSQILANTTRASLTYDTAGHVTQLANLTSAGVTLSSFGYGYDGVGNRKNVLEADITRTTLTRTTWTYDPNYRLINENRNGDLAWASLTADQWGQLTADEWGNLEIAGPGATYNVSHTYDPVGNRLVQNSSGQLTTFAYDPANQLATSQDSGGRTTFTFDATGNVALQVAPTGRTTYAWDIPKRLTQLWLPSGVVNSMIYNADDLRMGKTDSAGTEKFVWDQKNLLFETDIANVTQAAHTLKPDHFGSLISQRRGGASSFHHFDALGSTMGLTDILQNLTDAYLYQAYGASASQFGSTVNPFQWVGKLGYFFDSDPGQYYVRARNYDPAWARWLSQDPIGLNMEDVGLYRYCANRPTFRRDPSGLTPLEGCILGGGLALGLSAILNLIDWTEGWKSGCEATVDSVCDGLAGCLAGAVIGTGLPVCAAGALGGILSSACKIAGRKLFCDVRRRCPKKGYDDISWKCLAIEALFGAVAGIFGCLTGEGAVDFGSQKRLETLAALIGLNYASIGYACGHIQ